MTLYTKKEISQKLESLAKRIDSILKFTHLHLCQNDVKFLFGLSNRFAIENNQELHIEVSKKQKIELLMQDFF